MSKAFTKEDDTPLERSTRTRTTPGLPPGAPNYMTADGAKRLRAELANADGERAAEIERVLASVTIVERPVEIPEAVVIGAKVQLRDANGNTASFHIVGVDESHFEPDWVSWTSPIGRSLLGAEVGERVMIETDGRPRKFTIVRIDF
jgi:transcription elongation GreA/GreB family factor